MEVEEERITGNTQWDGLGRPAIFYAMISIWCGIFLSVVDGNICNVALPVIAQELGVSPADSIWVVNAFQLVVMMALLPFSTLGELYSYKKVYLSGVAVFTAASALCTFSHSLLMLTVSRAVQGLGAAMIMSVNTSIAKLVFPRRHLGKGVGINATVVSLSAVSGPSIAAAVLSLADWPWLFAINIPVGILTFLMGWRFLPDNPTHIEGRRFNIGDALLNAAVLLVVLGTVYVCTQLHRRYPMLPFDLLRRPMFSMSVITSIVSYTAQMMVLVGMPFMLLHNFGMDPVRTGAVLTSWPFVVMFIAPLSGSLTGRIHPGILGGLGLLMMSAGCFLLSHIPADAAPVDLGWRLALCGAGFGFFQSPNNHMLLTSAPNHRAGSASGMLSTARLTGQATGAALIALLFHLCGDRAPHDAMLIAGALTVCSALFSFLRLRAKTS